MPAEMPVAPGWTAVRRAESSASFSKAGTGSAPKGATAMTPARRMPAEPANCAASAGTSAGSAPPRCPTGVAVEADLNKALQRRPPGAFLFGGHGLGQGSGQLEPVHGVHGMGVLHDGFGFVALELADEVPAQLQRRQCGRLLRGLLVPVLPHVRDAQGGEPPDVLGRMEFGDHDQLRRRFRPAGCCRGAADPFPDGGEPLPELFQPRIGHAVGLLRIGVFIHPFAPSTPVRRTVRCPGRGGRKTAVRLPGCSCRSIRPPRRRPAVGCGRRRAGPGPVCPW